MKTKEELNALEEEIETVSRRSAELSDEELLQISGGAEAVEAVFLCEYEPNIQLYRASVSGYLLLDTLTGNKRFVENARDLEDAACELKSLR